MENISIDIKRRVMILYGRGKSAKEISKITSIYEKTTQAIIRHYRNDRNLHFKSSINRENLIVKMYLDKNIGATKISRYFKENEQYVIRVLKRHGIEIRKPSHYRTHSLNEDYFKNIDSERKAYFLGFITADGCISRDRSLMVRINKKDLHILNEFKKELSSTSEIKNEQDDIVNLTVHSRLLCSHLRKWNVTTNKTFTTEFPDIPKSLYRHFIRGIFDGDGSISINNVKKIASFCIACTELLANQIQDIMVESIGLNKTKLIKRKTIYCVSYNGRRQALKIYDWMYKDSTVFLERKHEKFASLAAEYKLREKGNV